MSLPFSSDTLATSAPDIRRLPFGFFRARREALPLHLAFVGLTKALLDVHDTSIKSAIESAKSKEKYTLMTKYITGGIALLVYTRDKTVTSNVRDVRVARAGTGPMFMSNKGAVAVRVVLDDLEESQRDHGEEGEVVFTFVCAHLAAHQHNIQRRNADWRSLVSRLVFSPDSSSKSPHFNPRETKPFQSSKGLQIYDTSFLCVLGDLNYRISTSTPKTLPLHVLSYRLHNELDTLALHDQLRQEQDNGRTLHGLHEGEITFKPTYKFKVGGSWLMIVQ